MESRNPDRLLDDQDHRPLREQRICRPPEDLEQLGDLECFDLDDGLARLNLGQVQQVVDKGGESLGGLTDEPDFLLLFGGQLAAAAAQQKP